MLTVGLGSFVNDWNIHGPCWPGTQQVLLFVTIKNVKGFQANVLHNIDLNYSVVNSIPGVIWLFLILKIILK